MLEDLVAVTSRRQLRFHFEEYGFTPDNVLAAYHLVASGKHIEKICIVVE
jgi:hypothetical protein